MPRDVQQETYERYVRFGSIKGFNTKSINRRTWVLMNHGLDCNCEECLKLKRYIKDKVNSGEVYLSGLENDKKKIMDTI